MPATVEIIGFDGMQEWLNHKAKKAGRWHNHMRAWLERELPRIAQLVNNVSRSMLPVVTGTLRSRLTYKFHGWNNIKLMFDESLKPKIGSRAAKYNGAFGTQPSAYYKPNGDSDYRKYAEFLLGDGHLERWRLTSNRLFMILLRQNLKLQWRDYWNK